MRVQTIFTTSLIIILLSCSGFEAAGQCTNIFAYGTAAAPTTATPITISSCVYQEEYNTVTGVAAATSYTSTNSAGGCITVHQGTPGGPVVGFGSSPLSWTSTVAGTYYIHYTTNCVTCATSTGCTTSTIACNSCGGGGSNPCTSPVNIASCGTFVTANMNGTGAGWSITNCGFTTPGDEVIYTFTPTVTGIYSLNITAQSGGYIDYFWANASGGCSAGATWNCIQDIFSAGTYGAMSWTAGNTYYILLDPEGTGTYSSTFSIDCPSSGPCSTITSIIGCGTSQMASMTGTGVPWNFTSCMGGTTIGTESIWSFTPTTTGVHTINVTGITGGPIDLYWMNSATGCSGTEANWNCIDEVSTTGSFGSMNWTAGVTYYILLDPEITATSTLTFDIDCPQPPTPAVAGDCNVAIPVCTNLGFQIDPSGYGLVDELCTYCTSNPGTNPADPANWGCLLSGELNSTWFTVNVAAGGTLEFSFGAPGTVGNCYDWIMWPYNPTACTAISSNTLAPTTCNWNSPCDGFTGVSTTPPAGGYDLNFQPTMNVTTGQQFVICFSNYSSALTSVPLNFFGTADISCTLLPVEITQFSGESHEGFNVLSWSTGAEVNNAFFIIEHSADGINFYPFAQLEGAGTDLDGADYRTNDYNRFNGTTYYRLKQVDLNGAYKYSNMIAIQSVGKGSFQLVSAYPNPSSETLFVEVLSPTKDELMVQVVDLTGKQIYSEAINAQEGMNVLSIPVEHLSGGVYMLSVTSGNSGTIELTRFTVK